GEGGRVLADIGAARAVQRAGQGAAGVGLHGFDQHAAHAAAGAGNCDIQRHHHCPYLAAPDSWPAGSGARVGDAFCVSAAASFFLNSLIGPAMRAMYSCSVGRLPPSKRSTLPSLSKNTTTALVVSWPLPLARRKG